MRETERERERESESLLCIIHRRHLAETMKSLLGLGELQEELALALGGKGSLGLWGL